MKLVVTTGLPQLKTFFAPDIIHRPNNRTPQLKVLRPVLFFLATEALFAQTPSPVGDGLPTFRADARLVVLHTSAVDKNGKLLTNIPESAFKVFENGVEQPLKLFRREDVPVSLGRTKYSSPTSTTRRTLTSLLQATARSSRRLWKRSIPGVVPRCGTPSACRLTT